MARCCAQVPLGFFALVFFTLVFFTLGLLPSSASAHSPGESYFFFQATDNALTGRMEIIIDDLGLAFALDDNNDGSVSEAEFDSHKDDIYAFLVPHIKFHVGDKTIPLQITGHEFREASFGTYALINFVVLSGVEVPATIEVEHSSFMEAVRPSHKVYLVIEQNARTGLRDNEGTVSHIFEDEQGRFELSFLAEPTHVVLFRFVELGIYHILTGFDHLAFLFVLLLPTVLRHCKRRLEILAQRSMHLAV